MVDNETNKHEHFTLSVKNALTFVYPLSIQERNFHEEIFISLSHFKRMCKQFPPREFLDKSQIFWRDDVKRTKRPSQHSNIKTRHFCFVFKQFLKQQRDTFASLTNTFWMCWLCCSIKKEIVILTWIFIPETSFCFVSIKSRASRTKFIGSFFLLDVWHEVC